jgi:hypothetical protein
MKEQTEKAEPQSTNMATIFSLLFDNSRGTYSTRAF